MTFSTASLPQTKVSSTVSTTPSSESSSRGGIAYRRKSGGSRVANIHTHTRALSHAHPSSGKPPITTAEPSPVTQQTAHRVAHQMVEQQQQQQHNTTSSTLPTTNTPVSRTQSNCDTQHSQMMYHSTLTSSSTTS